MTNRKFAGVGVFISVFVLLIMYFTYSNIGFPDGHLTEFDVFCKELLFPIFIAVNILYLIVFMSLYFVKKKAMHRLIFYVLTLIIIAVMYYYFSINLENGQGG
ncbi:hypothetical protein QSV08_11490 [Maribacter sp. BPC-D8]|uniref:hypothetical protein n=1 Tax=Maribacter sp. BPC-D8 TaxID=3053613 RepID=UPI002B488CF1|nr:hypothetical protein [Maribacter sp. BPC-D8]WRI27846.1 hypothetical protein QSV08_11490 [Maribacter sp. BPC-D8]